MEPRFVLTAIFVLGWFASVCDSLQATDALYTQRIKPLLEEKCIVCHGPLKSEAGLRLDAASLIRSGSDSGVIATAGDPDSSHIIERVTAISVDERMPPEGAGVALNDEQVALLRRWIADGMIAPDDEQILSGPLDHWAFKPIKRPNAPVARGISPSFVNACSSPIDPFLCDQQRRLGVEPLAQADRATLLRRLTFDLTGLPPTPEELALFVRDSSVDGYTRVVEQLLARPEYGERWGRHWMDVWRYSDWDGYKEELRGSQRHIWHWRDWIIESLNSNKPYSQMLREMIAGDEIAPTDPDTLRATGFLARSFHKSNRDIWLDATVEHSAKAFVGLTVNCARCHDHKYDPISQDDFYRFRAIFEPHNVRTDQLPGQVDVMKGGLPRAFDAAPDAKTFLYVRGNEKQPLKDRPIAPGVPEFLPVSYKVEPIELPQDSYFPDLSELVQQNRIGAARQILSTAQRQVENAQSASPQVDEECRDADRKLEIAGAALAALQARIEADKQKQIDPNSEQTLTAAKQACHQERTHNQLEAELALRMAERNESSAANSTEKDESKRKVAVDKALKELAAAKVALDKSIDAFEGDATKYTPIGIEYPRVSTGRRLALANWITDAHNPLTARVAVNHIWMRHFDQPLVGNPFDFGMKTPQPLLGELLDWLAAEFIESGWDMKHLHRLIVHSEAYRRASVGPTNVMSSNLAIDPDNTSLWCGNVRRLDAEEVRDSMLAVSGTLDRTIGGPDLSEDEGEVLARRSVYFRHAYEKQMSIMVLFDAASPNECYRRNPSIIPQQALALSNSQLARSMSRKLADSLSSDCSSTEPSAQREFVSRLFTATLNRQPNASEMSSCLDFLEQQTHLLSDPSKLDAPQVSAEPTVMAAKEPFLRARQSLAHILFNHNDFVCVR